MDVTILWLFPLGALLMTLVGAGMLVHGVRRSREWRRFVDRAEVTTAEVVELRRRTVPASDRPGRETVLVPFVRFVTARGESVESLVQYVGATPGVRPGDRFEVRYDPDDPRRVNAVRGPAQGSTVGCVQLGVGIGLVLLGLAATVGTTVLALAIAG